MHLTDDELVLHYYGEMSDAAEARACEHLEGCAVCRESLARLQRVMAALDQVPVPEPDAWFERRTWVTACCAAMALAMFTVPLFDPANPTLLLWTVLLGFTLASATQDIAIDAWRIEAADVSRQGAMAAAYQWGYRVGIIVAGAVPLLLADAYGWNFSYAVMAALMTVLASAMSSPAPAPTNGHEAVRERVVYATPRGQVLEVAVRSPAELMAHNGVIAATTAIVVAALVWISILGLRVGKWVHSVGGVLMLAIFAMIIALPWLSVANGTLAEFHPLRTATPVISLLSLNLLGKMGFGAFGGFEYVAIHAGECRDPVRSITRATAVAAPIIVLMFIGRVGVVTLAVALATNQMRRNYRYPEEKPIVG